MIIVNSLKDHLNYISSALDTASEIVIPVFQNSIITAVLDIDFPFTTGFDKIGQDYLKQIADLK